MNALHAGPLLVPLPAGGVEELPVVIPNRWQGSAPCAVGPFSARQVASYFAGQAGEAARFEAFSMRVFAKRDAWYVEVRRRREAD